jgi:hypothetical protein
MRLCVLEMGNRTHIYKNNDSRVLTTFGDTVSRTLNQGLDLFAHLNSAGFSKLSKILSTLNMSEDCHDFIPFPTFDFNLPKRQRLQNT